MGQTDYEVLQLASLIYPLLGELAELGDHDARLKRAMCLASAADVATPDALPMILKRAREWTRGPNTSAPKALQSIFSQIKITSEPKAKFLQPGKLDLRRLFPSDVMPDPGEIKQARVRTAIEVSKVFKRQDLSFAALLTQLGTVLEVNTWGVPSGFAEAASLYDEIRSVAAIAAALFRYEDSGEGRRTGGEFQLLVGDLSGIQRYIFAVANLGVGGVAKRLRARSFLLAITTVALAHKIVSDLGLSVYNILIQSGGTFQILLPNTERSCSLVDGLRKAVNKELYDLYGAELAFNLAATRLSGHQLAEYAKVTAEAFTRLRVEKTRPLHSVVQDSQGWCEDAFILDAHHVSDQGYCSSCKRLPAETSIVKMQGPEEVWVCNICQNDINVGRWFPSTKYLFVYDGEPPHAERIRLPLGLWVSLMPRLVDSPKPLVGLAVNQTEIPPNKYPLRMFFMGSYVPVSDGETLDPRRAF